MPGIDFNTAITAQRMRILVSNDDGIFAAGLAPLVGALEALGEVWVVAPLDEQSASSHALTMHSPLRMRKHRERWYSVSGTPADSVYMAIHHILGGPPDLVVSGINRGGNLGEDVHYSGTVAAAREGALAGIKALAVSLHIDWGAPNDPKSHWDTAAALARQVAGDVLDNQLADCKLFNLNVPDLPLASVKGLRLCRMGHRRYEIDVTERRDLRNKPYYWIGGKHAYFEPMAGTDGPAVEEGWASLTPMRVDLTDDAAVEEMKGWSSVLGSPR